MSDKALKMRDSLVTIVRGLIDRERPKPRIAEVYSYNRLTRTAEVLLAGETDPELQVSFPKHMQPTRSKMDDGIGTASGDIVLIEGFANNYRITSIITGDSYAEGLWLPEVRAQASLTGGGTIDWGGRYLKWSMDFVSYLGMSQVTPTGSYIIPMPDIGTVIQVHNIAGVTEDSVDSNGIDMTTGLGTLVRAGLYWEPTRSVDYGQPGVWHLVGQDSYYSIPSLWIMIAQMDLRGEGVMSLKLGNGDVTDHWRVAPFTNGWANYVGGGFESQAYRMGPGNMVEMRGLVDNGSINGDILILPEGYRPRIRQIFGCVGGSKTSGAASAGTAHTHSITNTTVRVDIFSTGELAQQDTAAPSQFISLQQIRFDAATQ